MFTDLPIKEIEEINDINAAKVILADNVTKIVHGNDLLSIAKQHSSIFNGGDGVIQELSQTSLIDIISELATVSKAQSKRLLCQGAIKIDGNKVLDDKVMSGRFMIDIGKKLKFNIDIK